jgi:hypothetical protein
MASVRRRTWKTASGETKAAWVVDYADSRGDRQRKHYLSKKAADAFRIQVESQMQAGTYRSSADKVTLREVCESFLEHCAGRYERDERMTRKMLAVYKGHVSNHILHPDHGLGNRKLSQLTARSVGDFRDRLRSAGVTVPTTRKDFGNAAQRPCLRYFSGLGRNQRGPRHEGHWPTRRGIKEDCPAIEG